MIIRSEGEYLSFFHLSKFLSSIMPDFLGKEDCRRAGGLPSLVFCRGVSHTPIRRPGRGERLFDGRVPVGRMHVRPTSIGFPALEFRRGVSHTPFRRHERGERSSDGWVPVGRMRYAPTLMVLPTLVFCRDERFFAPTIVGKVN